MKHEICNPQQKPTASFRFQALLGASLGGAVISGLIFGMFPHHEALQSAGAVIAGCAYLLWTRRT